MTTKILTPGVTFDGGEHARKRHEERLAAEKEAFVGLVLQSFDHPAVKERLRHLLKEKTQ